MPSPSSCQFVLGGCATVARTQESWLRMARRVLTLVTSLPSYDARRQWVAYYRGTGLPTHPLAQRSTGRMWW